MVAFDTVLTATGFPFILSLHPTRVEGEKITRYGWLLAWISWRTKQKRRSSTEGDAARCRWSCGKGEARGRLIHVQGMSITRKSNRSNDLWGGEGAAPTVLFRTEGKQRFYFTIKAECELAMHFATSYARPKKRKWVWRSYCEFDSSTGSSPSGPGKYRYQAFTAFCGILGRSSGSATCSWQGKPK